MIKGHALSTGGQNGFEAPEHIFLCFLLENLGEHNGAVPEILAVTLAPSLSHPPPQGVVLEGG
jgi:hypothetical protein